MSEMGVVQWRAGRLNGLFAKLLSITGVMGLAIVAFALYAGVAQASTPVPGGNLATSNWTLAGSPYIVQGAINIPSGVVITVEPGVSVTFSSGSIYLEVSGGGTLLANGTVTQPITFTSVLTSPAPGAWYGLYQNSGAIQLSNCFIDYAGNTSNTGVYLNASNASLTNCAIRNTQGNGLYLYGDGIAPQVSGLTILSSTSQAIYQYTINMSPGYHNVHLAGNHPDAVFIYSGNVNYSNVLDGSPAALNGAPFILNNAHSIGSGMILTITPGSQVRFTPGATGLVVNNGSSLFAQGSPTLPITFTSNAANPQPGDWYFLYFYGGASGRLSYCDIGYAGYSQGYAVFDEAANVHISHCAIHNTLGNGLYLHGDGITPQLDSVSVLSSTAQAIYQNTINMSPAYHNVSLAGNHPDAVFIYGGNAAYSNTLDGSPAALTGAPLILNSAHTVAAGVILTITPGSQLRFTPGATGLVVNNGASLSAQGMLTLPITFTSNVTNPQPGDWYYLYFYGGASGRLSYCDVGYAGGYQGFTVYVGAADVRISHCTIHNTLGNGLYLYGDGITPQLDSVAVLSSTAQAIYQNTLNMSPAYHNVHLAGNHPDAVFIYSGNAAYSNTLDGSPAALNGAPLILNSAHTVAAGVILTITPGSQLRFTPGATGLLFFSGASLTAQGMLTLPITFTSNAAFPAPGDWYYLYFYGGSSGRLSNCDIGYAGGYQGYAVYLSVGDVHINHCAIHNTLGNGLYLNGDTITPTLDSVTVLSSTAQAIYQNTLNMSPAYHNVRLTGNNPDAVFINAGNVNYSNVLDGSPAALNGAPFILNANHQIINGKTLTITPGSQLRFIPGATGLIVNNGASLFAQGTFLQPITFTSALTPGTRQAGDWYYIYAYAGSLNLAYCDISYSGGANLGGLSINGTSVQIQQCHIHDNKGPGIASTNAAFTVTLSSIYNNGLASNPPYGAGILNNTANMVIDARANWWGDPSGPYNIVSSVQPTNPLGLGNMVSDWVLFSPWLTQPLPWALYTRLPLVLR